MGVAVPIFFMILYYVKFGAGDKGCNQKLDINYTYHSANATSIYGNYTLKIMGNGMRDGFILLLGSFFALMLLGIMYNLLYNVILIH